MGYTMVTRIDAIEYRYTEWPLWVGSASTKGYADWSTLAGTELYNHSSDAEENENIVGSAPADLTTALSKQLRAGWRAGMLPNTTRQL